MEQRTYYEDNHGVKVTDLELILGPNSRMESVAAIPLSDIEKALLDSNPDWNGLGFMGAAIVVFYISSSWEAYLFALALFGYGSWIFFPARNRHHKLCIRKVGEPLSIYPLRPYGGESGRSAVTGLVAAIETAKRNALSGNV